MRIRATRAWMCGAALLLVAAQPAPVAPQPTAPPRAMLGGQLFIAPSGEPFRAPRGAPYPVATWFAQADRDHDGKISTAEFAADFVRFAATLDRDHDGTLRSDEITRYETEVVPEVRSVDSGRGQRGGPAPSGEQSSGDGSEPPASADVGHSSAIESDLKNERPSGGGRFGLINIPEPIAAMDVDFSGSVGEQEVRGAAQRRFKLLDRDSKGYLTLGDLPQTWAQLHPRRGG